MATPSQHATDYIRKGHRLYKRLHVLVKGDAISPEADLPCRGQSHTRSNSLVAEGK